MEQVLTLYHGSDQIVSSPSLDRGKPNNDYGQGFYCTQHYDLACEWASKIKGRAGFVNQYKLQTEGLKILKLSKKNYNILHWITLLVQNRTFVLSSPISIQAREYLLTNFSVDTSEFDMIIGYRADDSYFSFAEDFLNNTISVQHLAKAMKLGKLGLQHVLISERAFTQLTFSEAEPVDTDKYNILYAKRDLLARDSYKTSKANLAVNPNELYVLDIIRGEIKNGDSRLS